MSDRKKVRNPLKLTFVVLALTFGTIGVLIFQLSRATNSIRHIYQVEIPSLSYISTVIRLEQVLEMQVSQAVEYQDASKVEDLIATRDSLEFALDEFLKTSEPHRNGEDTIRGVKFQKLFGDLSLSLDEMVAAIRKKDWSPAVITFNNHYRDQGKDFKQYIQSDTEAFLAERDDQIEENAKEFKIILIGSAVVMLILALLWSLVYVAFLKNKRSKERAQQELEKQRNFTIQASKMQSLGEMASGVAHEINNPLAAISLSVGSIIRNLQKPVPELEKAFERLNKINATIERIVKIIRALRTFSHGGSTGDPRGKLACDILSDVMELSRARFNYAGIEIKEDCPEGLVVLCHSVQLEQVLVNLLNNSYDAIENLKEKWICIQFERQNSFIFIRVTDSGLGIPRNLADKMMEPFFSTKEVGKGTGLGLSVSAGIIEAHGGKLTYELFNGHTSFLIKLPNDLAVTQVA